jgi:hypothetical protein
VDLSENRRFDGGDKLRRNEFYIRRTKVRFVSGNVPTLTTRVKLAWALEPRDERVAVTVPVLPTALARCRAIALGRGFSGTTLMTAQKSEE